MVISLQINLNYSTCSWYPVRQQAVMGWTVCSTKFDPDKSLILRLGNLRSAIDVCVQLEM